MKRNIIFISLVSSMLLTGCSLHDGKISKTINEIENAVNQVVTPMPTVEVLDLPVVATIVPAPDATATSATNVAVDDELIVEFIDVGQADSELLICDGETMLIDGGNVSDDDDVLAKLKEYGITHLDYMVCSHAHEDHGGGLVGVLEEITVDTVYAPKTGSEAKYYKNFLAALTAQGKNITTPETGSTITLGDSIVQFVGPVTENTDDINNTSLVMKVTHGENSFLFTGDCSYDEEHSILDAGYDISADVLKVGHHGSETSTSYTWLREIMPTYGIIEVGTGNSYGHPTEDVLSKLRDADVTVYRTDLNGDIKVVSDGSELTITTEK